MRFIKHILITSICICKMLSIGFAQTDEQKFVRDGNKLYKEKKYTEAGKNYLNALGSQPNSYRGAFNLGDAYYKQGKYKEAAQQFEKLTAKKLGADTLSKVYHNLGNSYLKMSMALDSAIRTTEKQIAGMHDDPNLDLSLRVQESVKKDSLQQLEDFMSNTLDTVLNKSMDAYKRSLKANPLEEETRYNLAYSQKMVKKNEERINKNNKNKDKKPASAFALALKKKADDLVSQHKYDQAYSMLNDGLKKDPTVNNYSDYMSKIKDVIAINKLK